MATYDLLMIAILGGLTLFGYFKGMAWQVAYLASFFASYFVAIRFADQVAPRITFVNPPANKFVAMLLIYIVSSFVVWMLFRMVSKAIDSVKMEGFDHQMGAIIGFARGVVWCVAVTFFAVTLLPSTQKQQVINSRSGYYIARVIDKTDSVFPPEVHQVVGPYLDRLGDELHGGQTGQPPAAGSTGAPAWPTGGSQTPAQPAPSWGQPAPTNNATPAWPNSQPATPAWPNANNAPANQPSGANLGWPSASNGGSQNSTNAQQASWPQWP